MLETVSVDEAIAEGRKTINRPVQIIQLTTLGLSIYASTQLQLPNWTYILILPLALIMPWIYWSFQITKWRIWAFENVEDIQQLKEEAIAAKLIWPDGSIFEKTEIRTASDEERLRLIQEKLDQ